MRLTKWFKPQLCNCSSNNWQYSQPDRRLEELNFFLTRGFAVVYFLITIRPLFFMSVGSGKLMLPCNGTNILSFNKFEKLITEYKALKRVIINIQTSKNINAISHYYESYRTPRIKVFEELLSMWERLDELYQEQREKYLECYYRNRDEEHELLEIQKWIITPNAILIVFFFALNLMLFSQFKSILPKFEYQKLLRKWKRFKLQILVMTISTLIPEFFLPKFVYFLDYWFFVDYYLGL